MTRAFGARPSGDRALARDVRSSIHGSTVERRLLTKTPVLIHTSFNNKNGPQGPAFVIGRGRGIRTPDIQLPKLALYQTELYPDGPQANDATADRHGTLARLRRSTQDVVAGPSDPMLKRRSRRRSPSASRRMARPERFELPTTKFVAWYSIQLSYGRIETVVLQTIRVRTSSRHPCLLLALGATVHRTVASASRSTN